MKSWEAKLTAAMAAVIGAGVVAGLLVPGLLVPWLLASSLFMVNLILFLVFFRFMARVGPAAAAGVAVLSFLFRFGVMGLGLALMALLLPGYFLAAAVCFLVVYTLFLGLEIAAGLKGRTVIPGSGGGS